VADDPILSLPDAERLAEQAHTALPHRGHSHLVDYLHARVESDLAGLQECYWLVRVGEHRLITGMRSHARRYSDGLRGTAAPYGVTL
jgi:hypothetical protein